MKKFRTLELAIAFYKTCQNLKLSGAMKDQLARAALSIPLNLSEGSAKSSAKDRKRFYGIALASFREVECILLLAEATHLKMEADCLGAHLYRLWQKT